MPYFIYRVFERPIRRLEHAGCDESFSAASKIVKAYRAAPDLPPGATVRMVFATSELEAEDLLNRVHEPGPGLVGDE
ncbi:MAG: hypothetical protein U1F54_13815 [Burkholderiales bacterium]